MISFSKISKQYGKQILFVDASFQLNPGEKVGLVGPNGSGKTTLLKIAAGLLKPSGGSVRLRGRPIENMSRTDVATDGSNQAAVMQAIRSLPSRQRQVLVMRFYLDMAEAEVADVLMEDLRTVPRVDRRIRAG